MRATIVAAGLAALVALGIPTGALQQSAGAGVPTITPGAAWQTSLADVRVHSWDEAEETVSLEVTATVTRDHPVLVRDVFGFQVDGEYTRIFRSEAQETAVEYLNPHVPVTLTISYRLSDDETEAIPVIVDGVWQTQDANALQLPDHLVAARPVALVMP